MDIEAETAKKELLKYLDNLKNWVETKEIVEWGIVIDCGAGNYPSLPDEQFQVCGRTGIDIWNLSVKILDRDKFKEYLTETIKRYIKLT